MEHHIYDKNKDKGYVPMTPCLPVNGFQCVCRYPTRPKPKSVGLMSLVRTLVILVKGEQDFTQGKPIQDEVDTLKIRSQV